MHWRRALSGLTVGAVALLIGSLLLAPGRAPAGAAGQTSALTPAADVLTPGGVLFAANCASCHGAQGGGTSIGTALTNAGAASADFMLRTGKMPLSAPGAPLVSKPPVFDDAQIQALVAYVAALGNGPDIPDVELSPAPDLAQGRAAFSANCAACHGASGAGDAVGAGAIAPPLLGTNPTIVGEAVRTGPGAMPAFSSQQISSQDLDAIAAYLAFLDGKAAPGGLTVGGVGPVAEGYVAWLVYLAGLLLIARWVERRRHG